MLPSGTIRSHRLALAESENQSVQDSINSKRGLSENPRSQEH